MENAKDALIMAGSVIIFVVALTVAIYAFGEARQTSDFIMQRIDTTYDQTYTEADKALLKSVTLGNLGNKNLVTRTVGAETIIPTLYRIYKENLIVVFSEGERGSSFSNGIFARKINGGYNDREITRENKEIDLVKLNIGSEERATQFITYLLKSTNTEDYLSGKGTFDKNFFMKETTGNNPNNSLYKSLMSTSLYDVITSHKFNELIGSYYMEDVVNTNNEEAESESKINDANKVRRRIITYVKIE